MKGLNQKLAVLLILQVLIAAGLFLGGKTDEPEAAQRSLMTIETAEIDGIIISDSAENTVTLKKTGTAWQLPDYYNLPVEDGKVESIIEKLKTGRTGWPVARTTAAQNRFEVADEKYQRHVRFLKGKTDLAALYIGTSPGFRKVHVRKSKDDEIYAVVLNTFDFPAQAKAWFDKNLAQPKGPIGTIEGPDFHIVKKDDQWVFKTGEAKVNQDAFRKLLNALRNLRVSAAAADEITVPAETYRLKVIAKGKNLDYQFFEEKGSFYVRHPDYRKPFQLSKPDYDQIIAQTAESLTKTEAAEDIQAGPDVLSDAAAPSGSE